jgi:Domain of unknown function (DUF1882)
MTSMDLKLIKMLTTHYWQKNSNVVDKISFKGRTFFNKFEKIDQTLSQTVINQHLKGEITIAHSVIDFKGNVENIIIDYNGLDPERFYHKTQSLLREEGYTNFTAFNSKSDGHLHIYIHKGHTTLQEAIQFGKTISMKLATKQSKQWKIFPNDELPLEYNILVLPYKVYAQERGAS